MNRQKTLANASTFEKYKKPTKREKFLAEMERVVPWKELYALIEPFYPKAGKGRPPVGLERMLRTPGVTIEVADPSGLKYYWTDTREVR